MEETILYVGGMEFPDKNAAAQRVISNSKILKSIGYNVILAGMDKSLDSFVDQRQKTINVVNGFKVHSRPYPKQIINWIEYMLDIEWIEKIVASEKESNIVAIIAYNYPSYALLRLQKYAKKNNIKLIADCTEWYGNKKILKALDTFFRMRYVQKKIKNIICISDYLENYYTKNNCITVNLPSLIDNQDDKWIQVDSEKYYDSRVFSYVGSPGLAKEKDRLDYIINAFYELKKNKYNFFFIIVGITKEQYLKMFPKHDSMLLELENQIEFLGRISHVESLRIIKSSDFVVFARTKNRVTMAGFPTKLAESFSCGTPVVTNPTSNISKFVKEGKNGYLAKDFSINSLKESIELALNTDSETLKKMKIYCYDSNPLDYRNFTEATKKFIDRVI